MTEQDDFLQKTKMCAQAALAKMRELNIPQNSTNFHVWYTYYAGDVPDLIREIDKLLANPVDFSGIVCEMLYEKYFGTFKEEVATRNACNRLSAVLSELQDDVSGAQEELSDFGEVLQSFCQQAGGGDSALRGTARSVLEATDRMFKQGQTLSERVSKAEQEIGAIAKQLAAEQEAAVLDPLTRVANWKSFYSSLRHFALEATDNCFPLAILIVDVDGLAEFNERHGRVNGDQLLKMVARHVQVCVGDTGFVARHGDDSFGAVLPQVSWLDAVAAAEKIRSDFSSKKIVRKESNQGFGVVTLSIGVASYRDGESIAHFIHRCWTSMGRARSQGGNRVGAG
jgi:diguanylate cyclase